MDLITCLTFIERVIDKTVVLTDHANIDTIGGLKTVRDSYVNLLWLEKKLSAITPQLNAAISKYKTITDVVSQKVEAVGEDIRALDCESPDVWSDWQSNGGNVGVPKDIRNWADQEEYVELVKQVNTMDRIGYPNPDKTGAIRRTANMFEMEVQVQPPRMSHASSVGIDDQDSQVRVSSPTSEVKSSPPAAATPSHAVRLTTNHIIGTHTYERPGIRLDIPIIDDIKNIPPMFYYYRGNSGRVKRPGQFYPGIYIRLANGTVAAVPTDVEVVHDISEAAKRGTSKCKNPQCVPYRCGFAHKGANYKKLGNTARCPGCPKFGNGDTISEDCILATESDIRMVLLYGLNDIFSSALWIERNRFTGIFDELDLVN